MVVSHITVPPNMELPKHWYPGEEFVYVIDGSMTVWQKDKPETELKKGDILKISLKKIDSARTTDKGVTVIVFRVHEKGQPVRVMVE